MCAQRAATVIIDGQPVDSTVESGPDRLPRSWDSSMPR